MARFCFIGALHSYARGRLGGEYAVGANALVLAEAMRGVRFVGYWEKTGLNKNGPITHQIAVLRPLLAWNRGDITRQRLYRKCDFSSGSPRIGIFLHV